MPCQHLRLASCACPALVCQGSPAIAAAAGAAQAELAATAPALLGEAMEELLLGTLDGWAQASRQGVFFGRLCRGWLMLLRMLR